MKEYIPKWLLLSRNPIQLKSKTMKKSITLFIFILLVANIHSQDLSQGLLINDLDLHPMQDIAKPAYLQSIVDPSFGTTIRRITDAPDGEFIVPVYSTIQAWNADESLMFLYDGSTGSHQLLNGTSYEYIRHLDDISPDDLEQLFWDFSDPQVLYYLESASDDFIQYNVLTQSKTVLVNLDEVATTCDGNISLGNDVQMMSWDSDIISFRCNNERAYYYRISTQTLTEFDIDNISYTAPMPGASGTRFYHQTSSYDEAGQLHTDLNVNEGQHSCLGKMANGDDGYFAVSFAAGPQGGCLGNIVGHNLETGDCYNIISQDQGYDYPQSGTHISAVSHTNTEGAWLAASMIGYDEDGQELLDQELVIARADENNIVVCRIGHHRSDENEFDYWGEPHASMSPSGTRIIFGSDWSGSEDGQSVDTYIVELPAYGLTGVLPVALEWFSATPQNNEVQLQWRTAGEINSDYFSVERAAENKEWESITKVSATNNAEQETAYYYIDENPISGSSYYRLKIVDLDGTIEYSEVEAINISPSSFSVSPNPAFDRIDLYHFPYASKELQLYDLLGHNYTGAISTLSQHASGSTYDISKLVPGWYILRLGEETQLFYKM